MPSTKRTCQAPNCEKRIRKGRYCTNHYRHLQVYGRIVPRAELLQLNRIKWRAEHPQQKCSVGSCDRIVTTRGLCPKHYGRWQTHGTTVLINRRGRRLNDAGYVMLKDWSHPRTGANGYVREHVVFMERYLHRYLHGTEEIHHINGEHADNALENLVLFPDHSEHCRYHSLLRWDRLDEADALLRRVMARQAELCTAEWRVRRLAVGNHGVVEVGVTR